MLLKITARDFNKNAIIFIKLLFLIRQTKTLNIKAP